MAGYTVAISSDFFSAFAALPKAKQGRVMDFMSKFRSNPLAPGMNYEKINDAYDKNMRSVRIDDTYRAIVMRDDNVFLLLWVDHHDEAYDWARRKRCVLNHTTGSIQLYESTAAQDNPAPDPEAIPLFADVKDHQLQALGVPEEQYPLVRSVDSETAFYALQANCPGMHLKRWIWCAMDVTLRKS